MKTEVKRTNWSRFLKRFNSTNQYRPVSIRVKNGKNETQVSTDTPLMGVALSKKGRIIEGIDLFTTVTDPESLTRPTISIREPVKIVADTDESKRDLRLFVEGKDGTRLTIELSGEGDSGRLHPYVEKLAYSIYERRGHRGGRDFDDWLEAERLITQAAHQLAR